MAFALQEDTQLKPFNTFGVKASAKYFASISSTNDLQALLQTQAYRQGPVFILGGGSNVLFTRDYDGLVVKIDIPGIRKQDESPTQVRVLAGAGEPWHPFVRYAVAHDWGGVENLSLIPGKVGAAPIQNIGAYGCEVQEVIDEVHTVDLTNGKAKIFTHEACAFGYRDSYFKGEGQNRYVVTGVLFRLTTREHALNARYKTLQDALHANGQKELSINAISEVVMTIRQRKLPDPGVVGNAGSFFKNPVVTRERYQELKRSFPEIPGYDEPDHRIKISAGWLIEKCGWKGKRQGDIGVFDRQALVLVNYGDDNGKHILDLANNIRQSVESSFKIALQPEVIIL